MLSGERRKLNVRGAQVLNHMTRIAVIALCLIVQQHAFANTTACLATANDAIIPGAWSNIKSYIASLTLDDRMARSKSRLIKLRAAIVELESVMQELIDVVVAHTHGDSAGAQASNLAAQRIPSILDSITDIDRTLQRLADDGDLFAAQSAFKELLRALGAKRATVECSLTNATQAGLVDKVVATRVASDLNSELTAMTSAEEELAAYIRKLP